jgi:hypothetical protein
MTSYIIRLNTEKGRFNIHCKNKETFEKAMVRVNEKYPGIWKVEDVLNE